MHVFVGHSETWLRHGNFVSAFLIYAKRMIHLSAVTGCNSLQMAYPVYITVNDISSPLFGCISLYLLF